MERHYGLDWLRIGAFGLLILYHISMFFVPWGWHVKTAQPMDWVAVPMLATNSWRLPLLFVVSGYASFAVLKKAAGMGSFARDRTARLMIPVFFAILIIIPPQPWIELVTQHGYARGFVDFYLHDYFRFGALEGIVLPTWQHLWFVVYLWVYTLAVALAAALIPVGLLTKLGDWAARALSGWGLYVWPLAWLGMVGMILFPHADFTHALVDDAAAHLTYVPQFLFGLLLASSPAIWGTVRASWRWALGAAVLAYGVVAIVAALYPGETPLPPALAPVYGAARIIQGWCAVIALLGIADRFWNRDHGWRVTLTEAVFPFYIIHQTIIVVAGWWLLQFALPPLAEFAILVAVTAAGCWMFYAIGRRWNVLRPLIGLRSQTVDPTRAAA